MAILFLFILFSQISALPDLYYVQYREGLFCIFDKGQSPLMMRTGYWGQQVGLHVTTPQKPPREWLTRNRKQKIAYFYPVLQVDNESPLLWTMEQAGTTHAIAILITTPKTGLQKV